MIAHVLENAAHSPARQIFVSTHHPEFLDDLVDPAIELSGDRLRVVQAADNLADSVLAVADAAQFPLLITTADNCRNVEVAPFQFVFCIYQSAKFSCHFC